MENLKYFQCGPMMMLIQSWFSELEAMEVSLYYLIACLNGLLDGLLILDDVVWSCIVVGFSMLDFIRINLFLLWLWFFHLPLKSCHSVSTKSFLLVWWNMSFLRNSILLYEYYVCLFCFPMVIFNFDISS